MLHSALFYALAYFYRHTVALAVRPGCTPRDRSRPLLSPLASLHPQEVPGEFCEPITKEPFHLRSGVRDRPDVTSLIPATVYGTAYQAQRNNENLDTTTKRVRLHFHECATNFR